MIFFKEREMTTLKILMKSCRQRVGAKFSAIALVSLVACGGGDTSSTPVIETAPPPPVNVGTASTSTGAFGVLGTANERIAFIPVGNSVVPVLLESKNGAQIVFKTINKTVSGEILLAAPTVSSPLFTFNIDACSVDSNDFKAICIGYGSTKVAILDLKVFATTFKVSDIVITEFESGASSQFNIFSGGTCILCGVAADVGKQRFVIGGTGGFRVFNYANMPTAAAIYVFPVGENFALLPQAASLSYVVAPEYGSSGGNRKLRVINLDTGKTYSWDKSTDNISQLGADANNFQIQAVDAAAADLDTGMIALTSENSGDILLVDFKQASFNEGSLTFSAPHIIKKPSSRVPRQTDVAISTKDSLLLTHGEFTGDVGVMQLPTASGTGGTFPASTDNLAVFDLNDAALAVPRGICSATGTTPYAFTGKGDPHGLSLFTGLDSSQKGLIIDASNICAAVVDIKGLATAARMVTSPASIDTVAVGFASLVKFIKLQ
jgi:hypothetical protein